MLVQEGCRVACSDGCSDYDVVRCSFAHPKQVPLRFNMDMVDIHCPSDNGSHSLFHPSTEEVTHVQTDNFKSRQL